mmetsp:Transcript_2383/g.3467  ORF Transcript_2383/g.3467 Transcript_2383/m.3467 type:complete len:359 (+) Transcript_2383:43-1119(+)
MKTLGWGILGCGFIGKKQIKGIRESKTGKVVAIASRSKEKLKGYAKETLLDEKEIEMYDNYEDLINDSKVDVVYIPIPVTKKYEWIEKAAKAKKHVCFEKPMISAEEVKAIIELADKHQIHIMDNTMWVHHERTYEIQKKYLNEKMQAKESNDRIRRIHAEFNVALHFQGNPYDNIRYNPELEPMGSLGDLGWYTIRGILLGFNYELPEKVSAMTVKDKKTKAIIQVAATLLYADGRMGTMTANFNEFTCRMHLTMHSKNRIITIPDFVIPIHEDNTIYLEQEKHKKATYSVFDSNGNETIKELPPSDQTAALVDDFVKDAQSESNERHHWREETLKTMQVMDAIYASSEQDGKAVML